MHWLFLVLFSLCPYLEAAQHSLRVGMELSYPPFEMVCPSGEPCGISVDIANALGRHLNRSVKIQNISFVGLIPALNTNKVDLIISSLTVTDQRKQMVDFSQPYATTGLCLLISAKSTLQNISGADQPSRIIVVKSGTSGEVYASKHLTKAVVRVLDKESMCVLEVVQGKADAFIYDQLAVYTHWQKNLYTTRAALNPFQKELWAIAAKKGNSVLLDQVNAFLTDYRQKGEFQKLADKYLSEQQAAFKELGIPFIF